MSEASAPKGLAQRVLEAATYLSLRQILGLALSVGGMIGIAHLVGPAAYGTYAIVVGIYAVWAGIGHLGVGTYLIRMRKDPERRDLDEAFTILCALTVALLIASLGVAMLLPAWMPSKDIKWVAFAVFGMIVPQTVVLVPAAILERRLDYSTIAKVELGAQVVFQGIGLIAAVLGAGVWAPVIAGWAHIAATSGAMFRAARYRPSLRWNRVTARELAAFGIPYVATNWIWQQRLLVNSLVVGPFAGLEAAGAVAVCIRIVDVLASAKFVALRIAVPALGSIHADVARTARMIGEGAQLQMFALGLPLVGFSLVGASLLDVLLGRDWSPALQVFPFVATAALLTAVFGLESAALAVHGRNWSAAAFAGVYVVTFFAASLLLVPTFGILGYGLSEMVALPSYILLHHLCSKIVPGVRLGPSLAWGCGFAVALFWRYLGLWALAGAVAPLVLPQARQAVGACWARTRVLVFSESRR